MTSDQKDEKTRKTSFSFCHDDDNNNDGDKNNDEENNDDEDNNDGQMITTNWYFMAIGRNNKNNLSTCERSKKKS